jgi:branched-chain amino acid transport system ATP-binding protein
MQVKTGTVAWWHSPDNHDMERPQVNPPVAVDYRRIATDTIREEHRALGEVIELLTHLLDDIAAGHNEPEFHLLALALYYIDDFQCRLHHPKEEQHWFFAVRRRTRELDHTIAQLRSEHHTDTQTLRELHRLFVLYQAGAPDALRNLRTSLDVYAEMLREHMRKEEALLEDPRAALPEAEWRAIGEAFLADEDPLFGVRRRREFEVLHQRIVNLLPRKMRHAVRTLQPAAGS